MSEHDEMLWVRREWDDYRIGRVKLSNFFHAHWDDTSGGYRAQAPRLYIHGYIRCDCLEDGEVGHSCKHGPPPHPIKVCVVKKDNDPAVYALVLKQAGGPLTVSAQEREKASRLRRARKRYREADFTRRTMTLLIANGIESPRELRTMARPDIANIRGIGPKTLCEIDRYLVTAASLGRERADSLHPDGEKSI